MSNTGLPIRSKIVQGGPTAVVEIKVHVLIMIFDTIKLDPHYTVIKGIQ